MSNLNIRRSVIEVNQWHAFCVRAGEKKNMYFWWNFETNNFR